MDPTTNIEVTSPQAVTADVTTQSNGDQKSKAQEIIRKVQEGSSDSLSSLDEIKDPVIRRLADEKLKNLEAGYTKKFQALSEEKKKLDSWSPEKIQELLKNQSFVQATQQAYQQQSQNQIPTNWSGTESQWSALSDSDKTEFMKLRGDIDSLKSTLAYQQSINQNQREHELVKQRIPNYDSSLVDKFIEESRSFTGDRIKELVWKATHYDEHVGRSYDIGYNDRQGFIKEKSIASTPQGLQSSAQSSSPTDRQPNESSRNVFVKIAEMALAKQRGR